MCGIVGLFTKKNNGFDYKQTKMLEQLLFVDTLRGNDSTGVFCADNTGKNVMVHKMLGTGTDFVKSKGWDILDSHLYSKGKFAVGHNRSATVGGVSENSAHPFTHGHITLVHNGTLKEFANLKKDNKSIYVDSEAICYALSKADHWDEVIPKINGAFQLVWYDHKKKELFFAGNGDRPFWYAYSADGDTVYFASEWEMLSLIGNRNKQEFKFIGDYRFFPHTKNTVSSIPIDFTGDLTSLAVHSFTYTPSFFPPVVISGTAKKDTKSSKKETKKKAFGKNICWEIYAKFPIKNSTKIRLTGFCFNDDQDEVQCVVSAELAESLNTDDVVTSSVKQIVNRKLEGVLYISSDDISKVVLADVTSEESAVTINHDKVYKSDWDNLAEGWKQCGSCGETITWQEIPFADISFMGGRTPHYCMCSKCSSHFYSTSVNASWKN